MDSSTRRLSPLQKTPPRAPVFAGALLVQGLSLLPHPPLAGEEGTVLVRDAAGRPVAGVVVAVEDREEGRLWELAPTGEEGTTAWRPERPGLHVLSAPFALEGQEEPVLLLAAARVPARRPGPAGRAALVAAGIALAFWSLLLLRRRFKVRVGSPPG